MSLTAVILLTVVLLLILGAIASARLSAKSSRTSEVVEEGRGAFIQPRDLTVNQWETLEFIVGPDDPALSEEAEGRLLTQPRSIFVSSTMRVFLLDHPNFEIRAKTEAIQSTGMDATASWLWDVRPLTDGTHTLHARVEVLKRNPDGGLDTLDAYTRRVSLRVKVKTWQGFANALQNASTAGDLFATLFRAWEKTLVALGALIAAGLALWAAISNGGH